MTLLQALFLLGFFLSLIGAITSVYYSYKKISHHKKNKLEPRVRKNDFGTFNINAERGLLALSNQHYDDYTSDQDMSIFGNVLRAERQENLYRFLSINKAIPSSIASHALKELSTYSNNIKPDYVIGINRGGTMVGAITALHLNLPSSNFHRWFVSDEIKRNDDFIEGTVLIIDDISRTGSTLIKTRNYILENCKEVKEIITTTLFMYFENDRPIFRDINFYSYKVNTQTAILPWNIQAPRNEQFDEIRTNSISDLASNLETHINDNNLTDKIEKRSLAY